MKLSTQARYGIGGAAVAVLTGLPLLPWLLAQGSLAARWTLLGWLVTAAASLGCGAWLAVLHGRRGALFFKAYGAGILLRVIACAAGAAGAAAGGTRAAVWAYLAGWGAAYVPTQTFEMVWFARRTLKP